MISTPLLALRPRENGGVPLLRPKVIIIDL